MDPRGLMVEANMVCIVVCMYDGLKPLNCYVWCVVVNDMFFPSTCFNCISLTIFELSCWWSTLGYKGLTYFAGTHQAPKPKDMKVSNQERKTFLCLLEEWSTWSHGLEDLTCELCAGERSMVKTVTSQFFGLRANRIVMLKFVKEIINLTTILQTLWK